MHFETARSIAQRVGRSRRIGFLLVVLPALLLQSDVWQAVAAGSPSAGIGIGSTPDKVSHVGRWFTDRQGRVLVFHGAEVDSVEHIEAGKDSAIFEGAGFNMLHLMTNWAAMEPHPGVYDERELQRLLKVQQTFWRRGIYTLIDIYGAPGPEWAKIDTGRLTVPGGGGTTVPDPTGRLSPGMFLVYNQGEQNFWDNRPGPGGVGVQDRWIAMYAHVVGFFRDTPGIAGFSMMNEPVPGSEYQEISAGPLGTPRFDLDVLAPFYRKSIAALRKQNQHALVFYEPMATFNVGYAPSWLGILGDPDLVFDYHCYVCGLASAASAMPPGSTREQEAQMVANRNNAPAFQGERGFFVGSAPDLSNTDAAMQGWTYFVYGSGSPYNTNITNAWVRPYPRAIAGTPTAWSFDTNSKAFTFNYSTTQPNGHTGRALTDVFLPQLVYANGYDLELHGARVSGRDLNGQLLHLHADPGARTVTMRVTAH